MMEENKKPLFMNVVDPLRTIPTNSPCEAISCFLFWLFITKVKTSKYVVLMKNKT